MLPSAQASLSAAALKTSVDTSVFERLVLQAALCKSPFDAKLFDYLKLCIC